MASNCKVCGNKHLSKEKIALLDKWRTPFRCKSCQGINIDLIPQNDKIFLWPESLPEKVGSLVIPENVREAYATEYGVVLAKGRGHTTKEGFVVPIEIEVGDIVCYDKTVPWTLKRFCKVQNRNVEFKMCGYQDIQAIVTDYL